jgi:hypothetical protein
MAATADVLEKDRRPGRVTATMNSLKTIQSGLCGIIGLVPAAMAQDKNTPTLPGVPYTVHDMERPQPPKVATGGAVEIPPPADAKVLFGGEWDGSFTGEWRVEDGVLIASPRDIRTKEEFGAIQLHLEWRIPAGRKVNGQGGGNSGVFFMNRYEVQILESHDNETYPDGQAAALYGQYPPRVNASAPQGEWQSYDITFVPPVYEDGEVTSPATVTVIHNGVMVHHAQEYLGPTSHKKLASYPKDHPETGPIRLQWHGDPIEFRNIWVRPLGAYDSGE